MNHLKTLACIAAFLSAGSLHAVPVLTTGSWDGNSHNLNHYFTAWGVGLDVNTDQMAGSAYWHDKITSGSSAVMLLEVAGHAPQNKFGIFQVSNSGLIRTQLFDGSDSAGASLALAVPTGPFGFYLEYQGTFFYSDSTYNSSGVDQMVAYQGPISPTTISAPIGSMVWDQYSYLLAWEDLPYATSDKDFNDMVLMLRVNRVPDGGLTALMLALGLFAVASARRRLLS